MHQVTSIAILHLVTPIAKVHLVTRHIEQFCRKHLAGHLGAKMVKIGQTVQKIWQEEISRSRVTSSCPRRPSFSCSELGKKNCTDHCGSKIVKIGQAVEKIWQEEISRSCVTSSCPRSLSSSCGANRDIKQVILVQKWSKSVKRFKRYGI